MAGIRCQRVQFSNYSPTYVKHMQMKLSNASFAWRSVTQFFSFDSCPRQLEYTTQITTKGVRCPRPSCQAFLHNHCYSVLIRQRAQCPSCQQSWDDANLLPVGEAAARPGQDARDVRRNNHQDYIEEENSDDGDDEEAEAMQVVNEDVNYNASQNGTNPAGTQNRRTGRRTLRYPRSVHVHCPIAQEWLTLVSMTNQYASHGYRQPVTR